MPWHRKTTMNLHKSSMRKPILFLAIYLACAASSAQNGYMAHLLDNYGSLSACAIAGAANGAGDVMQFWYSSSRFPQTGKAAQFWNPELSWRNKWRTGPDGEVLQPLQERFWGSSRWFVGLTDGWHPTKTVQLTAQHAAIFMYKPEPRYHLSWNTGDRVPTRAKWWWKPADFLVHRAAFWVGWQSSVWALRK